jgi:hypothetical protein
LKTAALLQKLRWLVATLWFVSWFLAYLEIFRYHHVTRAVLLDPYAWFALADRHSQPGRFLTTVLVCSALAPTLYVLLLFCSRWRGTTSTGGQSRVGFSQFPIACTALAFGLAPAIFGSVNQGVRRPALTVDLTLRSGNGGFIVFGFCLALVGVVRLWRRDSKRA